MPLDTAKRIPELGPVLGLEEVFQMELTEYLDYGGCGGGVKEYGYGFDIHWDCNLR